MRATRVDRGLARALAAGRRLDGSAACAFERSAVASLGVPLRPDHEEAMKPTTLKLAAAALTLAGGAWISAAALNAPAAAVEYKFHDAPLNGLGLQNMEELRGKPIVIDFWGRN
jgi:hypothetical protein